jgi:hypothetical protein
LKALVPPGDKSKELSVNGVGIFVFNRPDGGGKERILSAVNYKWKEVHVRLSV